MPIFAGQSPKMPENVRACHACLKEECDREDVKTVNRNAKRLNRHVRETLEYQRLP
jgi:hypothetical protein